MKQSHEQYLVSIIQDLVFAYVNKDEEFPHGYEKTVLEEAYNINNNYDVQTGKYSDKFWKSVREIYVK